ncbi:MAG: response regulator [Streptococcus sp.]
MTEMKIMLVEDDINLAELIKIYLISENWKISIFHTGKEALEEFEKNKYDLILLDILLPDINGFEICKKDKRNVHYANHYAYCLRRFFS